MRGTPVGEIADALKKAQDSGETPSAAATPVRKETGPGDISEALKRSEQENPEATPVPGLTTNGHPPVNQASLPSNFEPVDAPNLESAIFHIERHRHLGLRIRTELDRRGIRSVAVVSGMRNEGKTTVACNLAAAMSSLGSSRSVALVDLDLRNPSIAKSLGLPVQVGVELVLQGRAKLEDTRIPLREPEIDIYACGQPFRDAHELLVHPEFESFIRELESRYSAVVIDTPPTLIVPDSTIIMRHIDACIGVARLTTTRTRRFKEMLDRLPKEKILGTILNNTPLPKHAREDYYYYYGEDE